MLLEDWLQCLALVFLCSSLHLLPPCHPQPGPRDLEMSGAEGKLENGLPSGGLVWADYCLEDEGEGEGSEKEGAND